ncbi:MAG TPA: YkgJ family cysteine cluster protein [Phycisphaerales bacterium]|nr:YkgJ family cysteine cluster protein [Phycisphaerales bacterium]
MNGHAGQPLDEEEIAAARSWLAAAVEPQISGELELVYEAIARAVAQRRPVCDASGRCCRFEEWGHRLYVTGLEAAYLLARLDRPLTPERIGAARAAGGCPFQKSLLCSVHAIRPLGCRVYYCDETAQEWQMELSERMLREMRGIHERHGLPYRYGEWRAMLGVIVEAGEGS